MELTNVSQYTLENLIRGKTVKRRTHEYVRKATQALQIGNENRAMMDV
jgi:hypothetical protein